ncbi:hypothetical protein FLP10_08675 [Agromyces intestinalis]|uniref:Lipoprotein n=1 Tax=Agromyces intestinalis TaxID=2592652 RepID=A0A5C1YEI1_9MICO|nr:hypothetical protein [Agromyces intestinalis]QEO14483.1 hypothetical protein FLP10_08675 [Agromyces intestinalis]
MPKHPPLPVLAVAVAATLLLSGCVTVSTEGATATSVPTATPSPSVPDDMTMRVPPADWECGQLSALSGILYRSAWEHTEGLIDDAEYASRVAAVQDAWAYMPLGKSGVTPALREVQQAAPDGLTYDNVEYARAIDAANAACDAAGSIVGIGALPGQGG